MHDCYISVVHYLVMVLLHSLGLALTFNIVLSHALVYTLELVLLSLIKSDVLDKLE